MLGIIRKKISGIIVSAGFCDFSNILKEDEEQIELDIDHIPPNIREEWEIKEGKLVKRVKPLSEKEWGDLAGYKTPRQEYNKLTTTPEKLNFIADFLWRE